MMTPHGENAEQRSVKAADEKRSKETQETLKMLREGPFYENARKHFYCSWPIGGGECNRLGKLNDILEHIGRDHLKYTPYKCRVCPQKFVDYAYAVEHCKNCKEDPRRISRHEDRHKAIDYHRAKNVFVKIADRKRVKDAERNALMQSSSNQGPQTPSYEQDMESDSTDNHYDNQRQVDPRSRSRSAAPRNRSVTPSRSTNHTQSFGGSSMTASASNNFVARPPLPVPAPHVSQLHVPMDYVSPAHVPPHHGHPSHVSQLYAPPAHAPPLHVPPPHAPPPHVPPPSNIQYRQHQSRITEYDRRPSQVQPAAPSSSSFSPSLQSQNRFAMDASSNGWDQNSTVASSSTQMNNSSDPRSMSMQAALAEASATTKPLQPDNEQSNVTLKPQKPADVRRRGRSSVDYRSRTKSPLRDPTIEDITETRAKINRFRIESRSTVKAYNHGTSRGAVMLNKCVPSHDAAEADRVEKDKEEAAARKLRRQNAPNNEGRRTDASTTPSAVEAHPHDDSIGALPKKRARLHSPSPQRDQWDYHNDSAPSNSTRTAHMPPAQHQRQSRQHRSRRN